MHLQASFFQLFALGLLVASTVAVAQKIFELYNESQKQNAEDKNQKWKSIEMAINRLNSRKLVGNLSNISLPGKHNQRAKNQAMAYMDLWSKYIPLDL